MKKPLALADCYGKSLEPREHQTGKPLMEIVPADDELVVDAFVDPEDIDDTENLHKRLREQ